MRYKSHHSLREPVGDKTTPDSSQEGNWPRRAAPLLGGVRGGFMVPLHVHKRKEAFHEPQHAAGLLPAETWEESTAGKMPSAPWLLALLLVAGGTCQSRGAEEPSDRTNTLNRLEDRRRQQVAAAQKAQVFYGFQFSDRITESQITFEHHSVDDAGRDYKAAHYDHGNGMAIADVDGDGLLDIYFTTQLGRNELWRNLGGGKFEDMTDRAGVALDDQISVAAAFADMDNDGAPDLFVTTVR